LVDGVGPVVGRPVRTLADVERLRVPEPEEAVAPVLEAVRLVRAALPAEKALVGFCGGPFTVAGYLVEGRPSRELALTKRLLLAEPAVWDALLEKLAATFMAYVEALVRAGADAIQLFDSWAGVLPASQYRERVATRSASTGVSRSTRRGRACPGSPCRGTSTRPRCSAPGRSSSGRPQRCSPGPAAGRGTSSTSATACCRRPSPTR